MAENILDKAGRLFRKRRYGEVISLLEPVALAVDDPAYKNSFDLYFLLGMSCLYTGDTGGASAYFSRAWKINMRNPALLLAQAAVFLAQGKTAEACGAYLDALHQDPENKKAAKALEFLRKTEDDEVERFVRRGKAVRFYPAARKSRLRPVLAAAAVMLVCLVPAGFILARRAAVPPRADLSAFSLSLDERRSAAGSEQEGTYRYILTSSQIVDSYEAIKTYFNRFRDNAAQVEINRLLNSNASVSVRRKARQLMDYLSEPGFDTLKDNYSYAEVYEEPDLYLDCWVIWYGLAANVTRTENSTDFSFLVGYDRKADLQGMIRVHFPRALSFDPDRPFEVLGQIKSDGGHLFLQGSSIYQTVRPAPEEKKG